MRHIIYGKRGCEMRAALYIDGNSTEEKMIPAICDEIHRSDDIVIWRRYWQRGA